MCQIFTPKSNAENRTQSYVDYFPPQYESLKVDHQCEESRTSNKMSNILKSGLVKRQVRQHYNKRPHLKSNVQYYRQQLQINSKAVSTKVTDLYPSLRRYFWKTTRMIPFTSLSNPCIKKDSCNLHLTISLLPLKSDESLRVLFFYIFFIQF